MPIAAGDYEIGPPDGHLRLRTYRQGLAAKAGHDLLLEAERWHGRVRVPSGAAEATGASVEAEIDMGSIRVLEGTGGVKPLTEGDRNDIAKTLRGQLRVADHPSATFRAAGVASDASSATIDGELTLAGVTRPVRLRLADAGGGRIEGSAEVVQSSWGIKPYSGFLGALKLRDAVDVEVSATLRPG